MAESKNDAAWNKIFAKYDILKKIEDDGTYHISAAAINEFREARLMAKFDHYANLPKIFKEHQVAILPISRSAYVIGRFDAYAPVRYDRLKKIRFRMPEFIESIKVDHLYSESAALHCAFVSGIISDLMEEEAFFTVSGRMSSNKFEFGIKSVRPGPEYLISVENSQTEIDGGFESQSAFLLIEAKNYCVEDFLVRQLYYPYRLWQNKLSKKVVPVFMTYSNDLFSFFVYCFENPPIYNSLRLVEQRHYIIAPEIIYENDIYEVFRQARVIEEPKVPFPQADKFERVVDLLGLLFNADLSKEQLTQNYQFDVRQTDYYTNAAIYLGLVDKYKSKDNGEVCYGLSEEGRRLMKLGFKDKYLALVDCIMRHEIFHKVAAEYFQTGALPEKEAVCGIMKKCYLYNIKPDSRNTIERRAQTVLGWAKWILELKN